KCPITSSSSPPAARASRPPSLHDALPISSASLIKGCRVVLTPDTGMMHIAAALKKPIVSVWGNTVPQFGMYPYYGNQLVNEFRADRKSTRLNSSHVNISYAVFCLKKKNKT